MKKIPWILASAIFLNACQTPPQVFEGRQCQPVFVFDSGDDVVVGESFCRCRDYHIGKDFIGSRGNVTRGPLRGCDQLLGYSVRDNTRLVNFMEYVKSEINSAESQLEKGFTGEAEESALPSGNRREHEASQADKVDYQEAAR